MKKYIVISVFLFLSLVVLSACDTNEKSYSISSETISNDFSFTASLIDEEMQNESSEITTSTSDNSSLQANSVSETTEGKENINDDTLSNELALDYIDGGMPLK